jgi:hypothetical protein
VGLQGHERHAVAQERSSNVQKGTKTVGFYQVVRRSSHCSVRLYQLRRMACSQACSCIAQSVYIHYLRAGLVRVPNDPFDNMFSGATWSSPTLWDEQRQDFLHDAMPVGVHSHNDYRRSIPLHEALASGCTSVEADVHLENGQLIIGHNRPGAMEENLAQMYLKPQAHA